MAVKAVQGSRFKVQGKSPLQPSTFNLERDPRVSTQSRKRAQSAIEYAVLIAICGAALVGMSVYGKRAITGKWRAVGDSFGYGRLYEPRRDGKPPVPAAIWDTREMAYEGSPWIGIWIGTGHTGSEGGSVFIGTWTKPDKDPVTAMLEIIVDSDGKPVKVKRKGETDQCTYVVDSVSGDGKTMSGSYVCTKMCTPEESGQLRPCTWQATIR